jgi:hypothetical protein
MRSSQSVNPLNRKRERHAHNLTGQLQFHEAETLKNLAEGYLGDVSTERLRGWTSGLKCFRRKDHNY